MTKLLVTVDVVLFTIRDRKLHLLLIERLAKPFENRFALPGGFVREDESLDAAAIRELREETGYRPVELVFLGEIQPDTGRLANRMFAYFARVEPDPDRLQPDEEELAYRRLHTEPAVGRQRQGR